LNYEKKNTDDGWDVKKEFNSVLGGKLVTSS